MQRLKKCWSVVSAKIFDVISPAPHSMLGIHFSSTHRPFPKWEIDFFMNPRTPCNVVYTINARYDEI